MLIAGFILACVLLIFLMRWLYYTPVAFNAQRVMVALSSDILTVVIIVTFLYSLGFHLVRN